ncbi:MAG: hypothetical protein J0I41_17815 [Filimonas sp.]|nr:hypothetical protein [Filimonas sp.]
MKWIIIALSFLNGGYMLADGLVVLTKGKFIGPEKPGPWAAIFNRFGVNVFALGPLFIIYGILWLGLSYLFLSGQPLAYSLGLFLSFFTLWYLPVGTLFSLIIILLLLLGKEKLGF